MPSHGYTIYTGRNFKYEYVEKELIRRYFNNTATPEEQQAVTRWLSDNASREDVLAMIQEEWLEFGAAADTPAPFEKVLSQALNREKKEAKVVSVRRWRTLGITAAACVAFLFAGIGIGYLVSADGANAMPNLSAVRQGDRTTITLSDGTEVILTKTSRLLLDEPTSVHQTVYLEGEASFNVSDENKPLIIKTKDIVTTAKGSNVSISALPSDSLVKVSVNKGKAEVKPNTEKFYPLTKLRIPEKKDSSNVAAANPAVDDRPKILPLIKLRPVVVKENEQMTFNRHSGDTNIGLASSDSLSIRNDQ